MPSSQPRTVATRMIHTSDARDEPTTQSSFTDYVFAAIRAMTTASAATERPAQT